MITEASLLERLLRYVQIYTTSDLHAQTSPSTERQWTLLNMLRDELTALGAQDITLTGFGYVLATIPASPGSDPTLPVLGFVAHVDTAMDYSGENVKPMVHRNYNGQPIILPDDPGKILDPAQDAWLAKAVGQDVVTASGLTLLGADDKSGVAITMALAEHFLKHPDQPHPKIRVCFTPDEEIGRGVANLDLKQLGADVAYTFDGEFPGEVNWETFSGDRAVITIEGVSTHPGTAKRYGMVNATILAAKLLAALPRENLSPETTDGREGFVHPTQMRGNSAKMEIELILRDHDLDKLLSYGERLRGLCAGLQASEPRAKISCEITPSYRNMGYWLKDDFRPVELALDACRMAGLEPQTPPIRGGTDGSRLTELGLPCPNLFDGAHNLHGPLEWVSTTDMRLAFETGAHLCRLWASHGSGYPRRWSLPVQP
jgi:tripeptide aminopeptidase